eukprot:Colp12_sorted_trinity150504_noHs@27707
MLKTLSFFANLQSRATCFAESSTLSSLFKYRQNFFSTQSVLLDAKKSNGDKPKFVNKPTVKINTQWSPSSRRTGVIAIKKGMMTLYDNWGRQVPVTVLQLENNQVTQVKTKKSDKYNALQIGCRDDTKHLNKPMKCHFTSKGVTPKRKVVEFRVTADALLPVGTKITAAHFVPGQHVDVAGITIGKGFQGVMKRHGMKGGPASHGVTRAHRKIGAVSGAQDPGRIFKGKRMAGHMGNVRRTTLSLQVFRINTKHDLIFVKGAVPGCDGAFIEVTDARRKPFTTANPPPFPTMLDTTDLPEEITAPGPEKDPLFF